MGCDLGHTDDQNDYLIYLKIVSLIEIIKSRPELAKLIKKVHIYESIFNEADNGLLNKFVDVLNEYSTELTSLIVDDDNVKTIVKSSFTELSTDNLSEINLIKKLKSLTFYVPRYTTPSNIPNLENLEELIIHDYEHESLRFLPLFQGLRSLKTLSFNHIHGAHDYNTTLRDLTSVKLEHLPLNQITHLELTIGCQEPDCTCFNDFLASLAPQLTSLTHLSIQESTYDHDHYITENFDLGVCQFLQNFTNQLKYLSIRHNPPLNGLKLPNNVEGNYLRRKKLYSTTIPKLKKLRTLIAPTLLGTCSCYEIIVSDLLWNGCDCDRCVPVLEKFDKYLMDHTYYDLEEGEFKDMLSCQLFGIMSRELLKRIPNLIKETNEDYNSTSLSGLSGISIDSFTTWSDLDWLKVGPREISWDFHSNYGTITCFEDIEDCEVSSNDFDDLTVCVTHFLREYSECLLETCPNLNEIILNGIYFNGDQSIYD